MSTPDSPDDRALRGPGQPAPYVGYGSPGGQVQPDPAWPGTSVPPYPGGTTAWPGQPELRRPGSVTAGVVLSWIGAGLFVLLGLTALLFAGNPAFLTELEASLGQRIDEATVTTLMQGVGALMLIWGIGVFLAALFAWRRRRWARILLTVMGVLYSLFQLLGVLTGAVAALVPVMWVAVAVGLLWTPTANAWFAGRPGAAGQPEAVRPPQPW